MARLTIRQASQQGFASTLAIHRHIKDGLLPVHEDGDVKLIEVDDLIAVFGEPAAKQAEQLATPANGPVDMREFDRLKAELEQKNKKNMWLAADLAEVVRELKEKEARFENERNRLLTVLEQAQALLLREVGRSGGRAGSSGANGSAALPADATKDFAERPEDSDAVDTAAPEYPPIPQMETPEATALPIPAQAGAEPAETAERTGEKEDEGPVVLQNWLDATGSKGDADPVQDAAAERVGNRQRTLTGGPEPVPPEGETDSRHDEAVNPLIPPLENPRAQRSSRRAFGTTALLLLFTIAGGGFVFFEFRTQVITGVNRVLQAFS